MQTFPFILALVGELWHEKQCDACFGQIQCIKITRDINRKSQI